jgi:hypothetical protein
MKKLAYILILLAVVLTSCNDYETYGDKKEKERNAIAKFIADSSFTVITEEEFVKNGYKTDLERREFVKLDKSGVYMQIVRQGCGDNVKENETLTIDCRYTEYDIINDSTMTQNVTVDFSSLPDRMTVTNSSGTFTATFISGCMASIYGSTSVPAGWIVPLTYIKVGRPQTADETCSKVRLIVPHTQGHVYASSNVMPYFYTITYQREI